MAALTLCCRAFSQVSDLNEVADSNHLLSTTTLPDCFANLLVRQSVSPQWELLDL